MTSEATTIRFPGPGDFAGSYDGRTRTHRTEANRPTTDNICHIARPSPGTERVTGRLPLGRTHRWRKHASRHSSCWRPTRFDALAERSSATCRGSGLSGNDPADPICPSSFGLEGAHLLSCGCTSTTSSPLELATQSTRTRKCSDRSRSTAALQRPSPDYSSGLRILRRL
jgi:hypothetical protein